MHNSKCSGCKGNLAEPAISSMHMTSMSGDLVCGVTGRTALVVHEYGDGPVPAQADADRVAAARREVSVLLKALDDHARLEGVEVEVRSELGWMDVHALAHSIEKALS